MEENTFLNPKENEENLNDFPEQKIQLLKEEISVGKKIETEKFIFEKKVESTTQSIPVDLISQAVEVQRVPMDKEVQEYPATRVEGNTTIISVVKEVPVITKKLILVEEIHITKNEFSETKTITETLREEKFSSNFNSEKQF